MKVQKRVVLYLALLVILLSPAYSQESDYLTCEDLQCTQQGKICSYDQDIGLRCVNACKDDFGIPISELDSCTLDNRFCDSDGKLSFDCELCGCPQGYACEADNSCAQICNDGTKSGQCSGIPPNYCQDGVLIENSKLCGCGIGMSAQEDGTCGYKGRLVDSGGDDFLEGVIGEGIKIYAGDNLAFSGEEFSSYMYDLSTVSSVNDGIYTFVGFQAIFTPPAWRELVGRLVSSETSGEYMGISWDEAQAFDEVVITQGLFFIKDFKIQVMKEGKWVDVTNTINLPYYNRLDYPEETKDIFLKNAFNYGVNYSNGYYNQVRQRVTFAPVISTKMRVLTGGCISVCALSEIEVYNTQEDSYIALDGTLNSSFTSRILDTGTSNNKVSYKNLSFKHSIGTYSTYSRNIAPLGTAIAESTKDGLSYVYKESINDGKLSDYWASSEVAKDYWVGIEWEDPKFIGKIILTLFKPQVSCYGHFVIEYYDGFRWKLIKRSFKGSPSDYGLPCNESGYTNYEDGPYIITETFDPVRASKIRIRPVPYWYGHGAVFEIEAFEGYDGGYSANIASEGTVHVSSSDNSLPNIDSIYLNDGSSNNYITFKDEQSESSKELPKLWKPLDSDYEPEVYIQFTEEREIDSISFVEPESQIKDYKVKYWDENKGHWEFDELNRNFNDSSDMGNDGVCIGRTCPMDEQVIITESEVPYQSRDYYFKGYSMAFNDSGGNPGWVGTDNDQFGWSRPYINTFYTPDFFDTPEPKLSNKWSSSQSIPFDFEFFGEPVKNYQVSLNGLITFDSNPTKLPSENGNLPSSDLPDKTIACFWDSFTNGDIYSTGRGSQGVQNRTFGTAPNRQLWIKWSGGDSYRGGFEYGDSQKNNFACVLEEGTNKIYMVDMKSFYNTLNPIVGIQLDSSTAVRYEQVITDKDVASSTQQVYEDWVSSFDAGNSIHNNVYYEFTPNKEMKKSVLDFDGLDDYIDIGNDASLDMENEITMMAWVKTTDEGFIIAKDPPAETCGTTSPCECTSNCQGKNERDDGTVDNCRDGRDGRDFIDRIVVQDLDNPGTFKAGDRVSVSVTADIVSLIHTIVWLYSSDAGRTFRIMHNKGGINADGTFTYVFNLDNVAGEHVIRAYIVSDGRTPTEFCGYDYDRYRSDTDDVVIRVSSGDAQTSPQPETTPPITIASPSGGSYDSRQTITLTADEPSTTYYTLDGTTPSTRSAKYSSPILISKDTTLKFFSVDEAGNREDVMRVRYIIDDTVRLIPAQECGSTSPCICSSNCFGKNERDDGTVDNCRDGTNNYFKVNRILVEDLDGSYFAGGHRVKVSATVELLGNLGSYVVWVYSRDSGKTFRTIHMSNKITANGIYSHSFPLDNVEGSHVIRVYLIYYGNNMRKTCGYDQALGSSYSDTDDVMISVGQGTGIVPDTLPPETTASPVGGTYTSERTITLTTNEPATIYYTLDGRNLTTSSTIYSGPITISADITLSYFSVDNAGNEEVVKAQNYRFSDITAPVTTAYSSEASNSLSQTITLTTNEVATTYYTIGGTKPTTSSIIYSGPITISSDTRLKFFSVDASGNEEKVKTQNYVFADSVAPSTTISLVGGTYNSGQTIILTANERATIYYTLDGTAPTTSSEAYFLPITISSDTTLKYFSIDNAGNKEVVKTQNYVFVDITAPATTASTPGGSYTSEKTIILRANEPATTYYTLDGSVPTTSSTIYTDPIIISEDAALKYFSVDNAGNREITKTQAYTIVDTSIPATTARLISDVAQQVILTTNEPAITYYTIDGTTPTTNSLVYSNPIEISYDITLNYFSVDNGGNIESIKTEDYKFLDIIAPKTSASPVGGSYKTGKAIMLTLSANEPATTYYTLDGSEPTISSTTYTDPISISSDTALKYFSIDVSGNKENTQTSIYNVVDISAPTTTASVFSGSYNYYPSVELKVNEQAATYYTLDETIPTTSSLAYSGLVSIAKEGDTILKFFSVDSSGNQENVKSETYTIDTIPPITQISSPGGSYKSEQSITLTTNEPATTYYTLDGSVPTTSSTIYADPIIISEDAALKYFSVDSLGNKENVNTEIYTITILTPPTTSASLESGIYNYNPSIELTVDEDATIYYTVDGPGSAAQNCRSASPCECRDNCAGNDETINGIETDGTVDGCKDGSGSYKITRIKIEDIGDSLIADSSNPFFRGGDWVKVDVLGNRGDGIGFSSSRYAFFYSSDGGKNFRLISFSTASGRVYRHSSMYPSMPWRSATFKLDDVVGKHVIRAYLFYGYSWSIPKNNKCGYEQSSGNEVSDTDDVIIYVAASGSAKPLDNLPTTSYKVYSKFYPIQIYGSSVLKYYSVDSEGAQESVKTQNYKIDITPSTTTASPDPTSKIYFYDVPEYITLKTNELASIYYTLDGTDPVTSASRIKYSAPIPISSDTTLKYYSEDLVGNKESVKTDSYKIYAPVQICETSFCECTSNCAGKNEIIDGVETDNTIDDCEDGITDGRNVINNIVIEDLDGGNFQGGNLIKVKATIDGMYPGLDYIAFVYSSDNGKTFRVLDTYTTGDGTKTFTFPLDNVEGYHIVRVYGTRWSTDNININSACGNDGSRSRYYSDTDDVAIKVEYDSTYEDVTPPITTASLSGGEFVHGSIQYVDLKVELNEPSTTYYTIDGTDPMSSDSRIEYSNTLIISETTKLMFSSVDTEGNYETVKEEDYIFVDVFPPTTKADTKGGLYLSVQTITLTANEQAITYYTLDGTDPKTSITKIEYNGPLVLSSDTALKFYSVDLAGNIESSVNAENYRFQETYAAKECGSTSPCECYIGSCLGKKEPGDGTINHCKDGTREMLYGSDGSVSQIKIEDLDDTTFKGGDRVKVSFKGSFDYPKYGNSDYLVLLYSNNNGQKFRVLHATDDIDKNYGNQEHIFNLDNIAGKHIIRVYATSDVGYLSSAVCGYDRTTTESDTDDVVIDVAFNSDYDIIAPITEASPVEGTYDIGTTQRVTLTAINELDNTYTTYYTLDGTTPTTSSSVYSNPITISSDKILKYFSVDYTGNVEEVKQSNYVFEDIFAPVTAPNLLEGRYHFPTSVSLSTSDSSPIVNTYYTIDGTTPTINSTLYSTSIDLPVGQTELKYFSVDNLGNVEDVKTSTYNVQSSTAAKECSSVSPCVCDSECKGKGESLINLATDGTVDDCEDGTLSGGYLKIDEIKIENVDGSDTLRGGSTIKVSATVDIFIDEPSYLVWLYSYDHGKTFEIMYISNAITSDGTYYYTFPPLKNIEEERVIRVYLTNTMNWRVEESMMPTGELCGYDVNDYMSDTDDVVIKLLYDEEVGDNILPESTVSLASSSYNYHPSIELTANEPATIYYTLDGATPTTSSSVYSGPITLTDGAIILKFFSVDDAGNQEKNINTENYVIDNIAPITTISFPGGTYYGLASPVATLTINEPGSIYYTTDGSDPVTSDTRKIHSTNSLNGEIYSTYIPISASFILKYYSEDNMGNKENVKTEEYIMNDVCLDGSSGEVSVSIQVNNLDNSGVFKGNDYVNITTSSTSLLSGYYNYVVVLYSSSQTELEFRTIKTRLAYRLAYQESSFIFKLDNVEGSHIIRAYSVDLGGKPVNDMLTCGYNNNQVDSDTDDLVIQVTKSEIPYSSKRTYFENYETSFKENFGNPGYLNREEDDINSGWNDITRDRVAVNSWSLLQQMPFDFEFYGETVNSFRSSHNGLITFDSNPSNLPDNNENLPSLNLPDKTIGCFWDEFTSDPPTGNEDKVRTKIFGTAPDRQLWIKWSGYWLDGFEYGKNAGTSSFACVLEESTNKIYFVDMKNSKDNEISSTVGVQLNLSEATQYGNDNINFGVVRFNFKNGFSHDKYSNNDYYEFTPNIAAVKDNVPYSLSTYDGGEFLIKKDGVAYRVNSNTNVNDGEWHHIAATYGSGGMKLYVDGNLEGVNTEFSGELPKNDDDVWIGRNYNPLNTSGYFKGNIDEVSMWNRALSQEEISSIYNSNSIANKEGLVLDMNLDEARPKQWITEPAGWGYIDAPSLTPNGLEENKKTIFTLPNKINTNKIGIKILKTLDDVPSLRELYVYRKPVPPPEPDFSGNKVKFQVRSAPNIYGEMGPWTDWTGPDGNSSSYFTESGQGIPVIHNGNKYFQYTAFLETEKKDQITKLSKVSVDYSGKFNVKPKFNRLKDYEAVIGETIELEANAYDLDGHIVKYEWDFGDGNITLGKKINFTSMEVDFYQPIVTITDNDGAKASKKISVDINVYDCLTNSAPGSGSASPRFSLGNPLIKQKAMEAMLEYANKKGISVEEVDTVNEIYVAVNDYISNHMGYVEDNSDRWKSWEVTSYDLFENSKTRGCGNDYCGDCEDFAYTTFSLMRALGISEKCIYVVTSPTHVFNVVNIDSKFRILEPQSSAITSYFNSESRWDAHDPNGIFNDYMGNIPGYVGESGVDPYTYTLNYPDTSGMPDPSNQCSVGDKKMTYYLDICP